MLRNLSRFMPLLAVLASPLFFLSLGGKSQEDYVLVFPQVGDGVAGSLRFQSSLILNNSGPSTNIRMEFFDAKGRPMEFPLEGLGTSSSFEVTLKKGVSFTVQSPGEGPLRVGYLRVRGRKDVGGTVVFTRSDAPTGTIFYEAGVPAARPESDFSLLVDSLGSADTGIALANVGEERARLTARLYDLDFQLLGTAQVELGAGERLARFVWELFQDQPQLAALAQEMRGILTVESDRPLAALTVRQNDDPASSFPERVPTLTTFPVVAGRADRPGGIPAAGEEGVTFFFPQVGDGSVGEVSLRSSLLFVNTGEDTLLRIEFLDQEGEPLPFTLQDLGTDSLFEIPLEKGKGVALETTGEGDLKVGYVRVTAGKGVGGTAVFTRALTSSGTILYEAGVPASLPLPEFSLVVDSRLQRDTGLALANPGGEDRTVVIRLYDERFELIASTRLLLQAGQKLARFIWEFFPQAPEVRDLAREMQGSVTVEGSGPLVAVTLRQNDDPQQPFPLAVPTLTAFPVLTARADVKETTPPYPPSPLIRDVFFDLETHRRFAEGSDGWPVTWAGDGHQYSSWGNGGGFGGSEKEGRVSLGVARVEGLPADYRGFNRWGGKDAENPAQFGGKSYGILSLEGTLYMWVSPGSNADNYQEARLAFSTDWGASWTLLDWAFRKEEGIILPTFCQFGQDYAGARDNFVYIYAARLVEDRKLMVQKPGRIDLMRVEKNRLQDRSAYEFFAGLDETGQPLWVSDQSQRKAVFEDPNGVGWSSSVSFNGGLGRYLLITEHEHSFAGNLGIFDAPEPWGPWTTVAYYSAWGSDGPIGGTTFFSNFANKWLSPDGTRFQMLFSGVGSNDAWNSISGSFLLRRPE